MKKRINLLTKHEKYRTIEEVFQKLRWLLGLLTGGFFVAYAFLFLFLSQQRTKINTLLAEKQTLLGFLLQNKEVEAKFIYFSGKYKQLNSILKDDVNFYPYYNLLNESLKSASPTPSLSSLVINKDKTTTFTLTFDDLNSLVSFLKFTESDVFVKNFSELTLISFASDQKSINKSTVSKNLNYKLDFKGKFKEVL